MIMLGGVVCDASFMKIDVESSGGFVIWVNGSIAFAGAHYGLRVFCY